MDDHLHLKLAIRCLSFVGFWPLQFRSNVLALLYSAYFKITMAIYVLVVIAEFVELYRVLWTDLEELSVLLGLFLFHLLGLAKLRVLAGETVEKLKRQIIATERNILRESEDPEIRRIYMDHVKTNHAANRIMIYIASFCYVLFTLSPYFTDLLNRPEPLYDVIDDRIVYRARPLPLPTWFPFDRYKYYWIRYGWHVIALSLIPPCIIGLNTFFYGLIIFANGQLKILQHDLRNVKASAKNALGEGVSELAVNEKLRKCILYHKAIILYVADLSDAMKIFLLFDFVGCGLQIAVIGFQAAVMEFSPNLIKTVWYLVTMLTQLFLFYWFANETLLESVDVAKAAWECEWYTCSENTKRTLLIATIRAQKPLILSVGSFNHMSTETLVSIMRVGYSYAMLMRRVYGK